MHRQALQQNAFLNNEKSGARDGRRFFAEWLAVPGGSFHKAFVLTGASSYSGTYKWESATPLKKIVTGDVSNAVSGTTHADDDYELLAKGLGGYNQGVGIFSGGAGDAWINVLINRASPASDEFRAAAAKDYTVR
jgi:hypothetical protein